jgi:diamine N-acetyltransferase
MSPTPIAPDLVTLREITEDTVVAIVKLVGGREPEGLRRAERRVAGPGALLEAAWYRAIYAGDEPVGFVMLYDESLRTPPPEPPGVGVWRFMVDERHQGRGIGRQALARVIDHVRAKGVFTTLELSYVPGPGCPEPFYRSMGFRPTGRMDGDEVVLELPL